MGWHHWESLGRPNGATFQSIAAASWANGRLDIVGSTSATVYSASEGISHLWYEDPGGFTGKWGSWHTLISDPKVLTDRPIKLSMTSWGPGRLDCLFMTGGWGPFHFWHENGWKTLKPELIDGHSGLSSEMVLTSQGVGTLDLFSSTHNNKQTWITHAWYDPGSGWTPFTRRSEIHTSHPGGGSANAAVAWAPGRMDLFFSNRHAWFERYWGHADGEIVGDVQAVVSRTPGSLDIFVVSNGIARWRTYADGWQDWEDIPALDISPASQTIAEHTLAATTWGPDRVDVFAVDANSGELIHTWWRP